MGEQTNTDPVLGRRLRNDRLRAAGFRVDLPDGEHAIMRDPRSVTEGQRIHMKEVIARAQVWAQHAEAALREGRLEVIDTMVAKQAETMASSDRLVVAAFVERWSYESIPAPQPHDIEPLRLLTGQAFDRLLRVAKDLWDEAWLDTQPTSMEDDSPFVASNNSAPTS